MIGTKYSEIYEKVIADFAATSADFTSYSYSLVVLDSLLSKMKPEFEFLKFVTVKTSSFSSNTKNITVGDELNYADREKVCKALDDILKLLINNLGSRKEQFNTKFKERLGPSYLLKLKNMNIEI